MICLTGQKEEDRFRFRNVGFCQALSWLSASCLRKQKCQFWWNVWSGSLTARHVWPTACSPKCCGGFVSSSSARTHKRLGEKKGSPSSAGTSPKGEHTHKKKQCRRANNRSALKHVSWGVEPSGILDLSINWSDLIHRLLKRMWTMKDRESSSIKPTPVR